MRDLKDFIKVHKAPTRTRRKETERFRKFTYDEIVTSLEEALEEFRAVEEALQQGEN